MPEIKTRDMTRGTIKTLDRAASSMHHLKEETIRSKTADIDGRYDNESADSYAQDRVGQYAGGSAAFASRTGIELMLKSREKTANIPANNEQRIQQAFREQGIKTIRDCQSRKKMADAEVFRNTEEDKLTGWIRGNRIIRKAKLSGYGSDRAAVSLGKALKSDDPIQRRRKEYAISRITARNAGGGVLGRVGLVVRGTNKGKNARRTGRILRSIAESSKAMLSTLSISGAVAVGVIVIMVFFSAALNMTEDGNYITGTGDTAIVEVARAQLGNVGGDKFWKWYGFNSHVHWCACFVSWCADQCGYIDAGIYPRFAGVGEGASWFKSHRRWAGGGYIPNPGDTIFFDFESDGELDHVGLVETCDGRTITTIEGNSGDVCRRNTYTVKYAGIAGYGLMVRPTGNTARLITLKAAQLAYPDSPKDAKYPDGKPTSAYKAALKRAYPNRSGWGKPPKDGASCDVFVGVVMVDSGIDKNFPRGLEAQQPYLARSDKFECMIKTTSSNIKESDLRDGDIITYLYTGGGGHICIYNAGKLIHAAYNTWYPRTSSPGSRLKISGKKWICVYRVKD